MYTKKEALPTRGTMAARKGPFEETGLEVGVKENQQTSSVKTDLLKSRLELTVMAVGTLL